MRLRRERYSQPGWGLGKRIFAAMALVVVAGAATLFAVSLLLAPALFHKHLVEANVAQSPEISTHIEEGFATAISVALIVGVLAATAVAASLALLVARRVAQPIADASTAATRLAAGDYSARVVDPRLGVELNGLAESINTLARRLENTEITRSRLLADFVHELRTPLASIEATVEAIVDGILPADADTLRTLTDQSRRLSRMTDDLAALSRAQEHAFHLHQQPIDLVTTAQRAAAAVGARFAQAGVQLQSPTGGPVAAYADPDRVTEVLGQLLDNALSHTRPGDTVMILTQPGDNVGRLLVTDTGSGFEPSHADRLFQRFHREPAPSGDQREGTGIGLTIARNLIDAQGGQLTATSPGPGRGATFTITLPCQQ